MNYISVRGQDQAAKRSNFRKIKNSNATNVKRHRELLDGMKNREDVAENSSNSSGSGSWKSTPRTLWWYKVRLLCIKFQMRWHQCYALTLSHSTYSITCRRIISTSDAHNDSNAKKNERSNVECADKICEEGLILCLCIHKTQLRHRDHLQVEQWVGNHWNISQFRLIFLHLCVAVSQLLFTWTGPVASTNGWVSYTFTSFIFVCMHYAVYSEKS